MVENQNDVKVKQIRANNRTEFKNSELESFCDEKGISQNFSSPYTPEQNGVAERKNITLIEAARTMLNGLVLSNHFWTEVVRIACYTLNRSIIDHLGKFDVKADDGYFIGYLFNYKAFRVFNTRRQQIEESYHVKFDKSIKVISFINTLVDEIRMNDSSRYPPDEFLQEDGPSRKYQAISDFSYYIIPHGPPDLVNTKGTQEQDVQDEQINHQPTEELLENNTENSAPITKPLVPEVSQSQITHHASKSLYHVAQDKWSKDQHIELVNIIGDPYEGMLTKSMAATLTSASSIKCLFAHFLSKIELIKVSEALKHPGWVDAMQEELNQFYKNNVWTLVPLPHGKIAIGSKWVFRNKKVARMEATRIFLALATYMNFIVFQMDVKSAFLN
ncbi:retrovirus-related pol polyprotein from transposon TNT 1-94 [Tanacetum coccineum]